MNSSNQIKAGALLSYVVLVISTVIPIFYTPIMLRLLGQAEYGLYSLSNSVISYLSLLTLGLGSTIHRYLMRYLTAGDKVMLKKTMGLFVFLYGVIAAVTMLMGVGLTACTGKFFARGLTAFEIPKLNALIVIMTVSAGISLLAIPYASVVTCHERYVFQKVLSIITTIATPLINLAVLYLGFASVGMALAGVALQIVTLLCNVWYSRFRICLTPSFRALPWHMLREIMGFTMFVFIAMIADLLYWATDKVLIGALIGSTAVAVYNIGVTFQSILQQLSSAISGVFGTRVNHLVFSGRPISDVSELMIRVGRIQYLIVSLAVSGFITFGQSFLGLWVGAGYEEAYYVALLTMIPSVIPLIQNVAFNTIVALNKHHFRSILYVILAVANVVSTYLLISVMGIIGAALCTCVVFLLGHGIIINWYYQKRIGLDILRFWGNILRMSIVPAVMVCAGLFAQRYICTDTISVFLGAVVVYTGVFCLFSWIFSMNQYEKNLIRSVLGKVIPRRR